MSKPTGKLLLAYQTISTMEEKISAVQLRLNASEARNAELCRLLKECAVEFSTSEATGFEDHMRAKIKKLLAQSAPATDEQVKP